MSFGHYFKIAGVAVAAVAAVVETFKIIDEEKKSKQTA